MPSLLSILLLLFPILTLATDFKCSRDPGNSHKIHALPLKLAAMFSILVSGAVGVCVPVVGQHVPSLGPETDLFFIIKAFAAGVILATGFVHILPDAYDYLMSPCLHDRPWGEFPFAGFIAMLTAIGTLIGETVSTGYINRAHAKKLRMVVVDQQTAMDSDRAYAHGSATAQEGGDDHADLIRRRIISQVLEIGIIVHSVIIGISLGASQSPSTIKPLVVALSFHQFFEGMGLGGALVQAKFKKCSTITMVIFFSLTNPIGIATGIGISLVYNVHSPTALIVEGILNSAAAGILIYMALVDLLAADFMNPRVQSKGKLQLLSYLSLLAGAGLMSLLAKWT